MIIVSLFIFAFHAIVISAFLFKIYHFDIILTTSYHLHQWKIPCHASSDLSIILHILFHLQISKFLSHDVYYFSTLHYKQLQKHNDTHHNLTFCLKPKILRIFPLQVHLNCYLELWELLNRVSFWFHWTVSNYLHKLFHLHTKIFHIHEVNVQVFLVILTLEVIRLLLF